MLNNLTELQKQYLYAVGTVFALIALAVIVSPVAWLSWFVWSAVIFCSVCIAGVIAIEGINSLKPAKVEYEI